MDVEQYINNYSGSTKVTRLAFIARQSEEARGEALRLAFDEVKRTNNTKRFWDLWNEFHKDEVVDEETRKWATEAEKVNNSKLGKLQHELQQYKTNLIRESIRMGYQDVGDMHVAMGDFDSALKAFVRTRDYCATSHHVLTTCLNVIHVSLETGNFGYVNNYVTKAEATPETNNDKAVVSMLRATSAIALLHAKKYKSAALRLVECSVDMGARFNHVVSCQDVAMYGALCALASFSRSELKTKVLDNLSFKAFLELAPDVRECIVDFHASRYRPCLERLAVLTPQLKLDLYVHEHVGALVDGIRSRALCQYFQPYQRVHLPLMADTFACSVDQLEKELCDLVAQKKIDARIDAHNKVLQSRAGDDRAAAFARVAALGRRHEKDMVGVCLRANCLRYGYTVHRPADTPAPSVPEGV